MKLTIQQAALTHLATVAGRVAPGKPATTIEGLVLLSATEDDRLSVRATDYRLTAQASSGANVMEPGAVAVSARLLAALAKALPKGREIELIAAETLWVRYADAPRAAKGSWELPLGDADIYPGPPVPGELVGTVAGPDLAAALDRVVPFAGDPTKRDTNGLVQLVAGEALTLVTTDGYRLALAEVPWRPVRSDGLALTTPAAGLALLADVVGSSAVEVSASDGTVTFATDDLSVTGPLWERYVAWQSLALRRDAPSLSLRVQLDTAAFAEALARAGVLLSGRDPAVRVTIAAGQVTIAAPDVEARTDAVESMPCVAYEADDGVGEFVMGAAVAYLREGVAATKSPRVELALPAADPYKAFLLTPIGADGTPDATYRHVCMPRRLPSALKV